MNAINRHKLAVSLGMFDSSVVYQGEWLNMSCPLAPWRHSGGTDKKPSFGIRRNDGGESIYKCWSCGSIGSVSDLVFLIRHLTKKFPKHNSYDLLTAMQLIADDGQDSEFLFTPVDYEAVTHANEEVIFPTSWLNSFFPKHDHPYMLSRGLGPDIGKMFDVRVDIIDKRVCFPMYSFDGRLLGLQGRTYVDSELRYKMYDYKGKFNTHVWGNERNVNLDDPTVLTEGFFDAGSIARVYPNVLPSLTSSLSIAKLKRIRDVSTVITFYDFGTGGNHARDKIDEFFYPTDTAVYHCIPTEEEGDAGALSVERLKYYLGMYLDV